jgi:hypothetical protein
MISYEPINSISSGKYFFVGNECKIISCRKRRLNTGGYEYGKFGKYFGNTSQNVYSIWYETPNNEEKHINLRARDNKEARMCFGGERFL